MPEIIAFQPQQFPQLHMLARIQHADIAVVLPTAQFTPKGKDDKGETHFTGQQHFLIGGSQGPRWVPVPVKKKRGQICAETKSPALALWREDLVESILMDYSRAPNKADLEKLLDVGLSSPYLYDNFWAQLRFLLPWFDIETPIRECTPTPEYHNEVSGSQWMLDICLDLEATTYVCGRPSLNYLDLSAFEAEGIEVVVQDWTPTPYPQIWKEPQLNLSFIDAVAHGVHSF